MKSILITILLTLSTSAFSSQKHFKLAPKAIAASLEKELVAMDSAIEETESCSVCDQDLYLRRIRFKFYPLLVFYIGVPVISELELKIRPIFEFRWERDYKDGWGAYKPM